MRRYTSSTSGTGGTTSPFETIQGEEVGTTLKVTPRISEGDAIELKIEQKDSSPGAKRTDSADISTNERPIKMDAHRRRYDAILKANAAARPRPWRRIKIMHKILLIDDDVKLTSLLRDYMQADGFSVHVECDGAGGIGAALSGEFDLVVLDVMMPRLSGLEVLRQIRDQSTLPVLMLTARGDDIDRITGLELGADDYVPKPSTPRELIARIRAILRRTQSSAAKDVPSTDIVSGDLRLWSEARRAEWLGQPLKLTSTEFNLLEVLLRNAGRPVSKNELSERALGRPLARHDRNIDVHVSSIRRKLGTLADGRPVIQSVHRLGYQLIKE